MRMYDWLRRVAQTLPLTWESIAIGTALFVVTFVGSIAVVSILLVKIPATYFLASHPRDFWLDRHPAVRWSGLIAKNILGLLLVLLGILMSLPGVPGQGVLTVLLGVMLLDFPRKRELELRIVRRPAVLRTINRLRARFEKPPLVLD